jgi:hypothetical protein
VFAAAWEMNSALLQPLAQFNEVNVLADEYPSAPWILDSNPSSSVEHELSGSLQVLLRVPNGMFPALTKTLAVDYQVNAVVTEVW